MRISNQVSCLALVVCPHLLVLVAIPNFVVPPAWNTQRDKAIVNFMICLVPLLFSLFVILRAHDRSSAIVGWSGVFAAIWWIAYAVNILRAAFA